MLAVASLRGRIEPVTSKWGKRIYARTSGRTFSRILACAPVVNATKVHQRFRSRNFQAKTIQTFADKKSSSLLTKVRSSERENGRK